MDAVRFDALTRSLASRSSRRVALAGVAAAVLVVLGLALDQTTVLAKKKHKGKGKGKAKKKHKKNNQKPGCPRPDAPLSPDACGGECTNFLIDDDNCGGCATTGSPPGSICIPGRTTCVEGSCVAGDIDSSNCREVNGGPGCPPEAVCCKEPIGQDDPQVYELHCRALKTNENHCGTCNHACTEGKQPACCFGRCRDLDADPLNCGSCFRRCPQTQPLCSAGQCREACPPGLTKCGTTCFHQPTEACCTGKVIAKEDLQFDDENCGECGRECSPFSSSPGECCGGKCLDVNFPDCCGGQRTNLAFDDANCGTCGTVCRSPSLCRFGACN